MALRSATSAPRVPGQGHILPDLLQPGLALVFCGTAAGTRSARERAYYAHPGNLFWRALFESGLTPRQLLPGEFGQLADYGIGLTDLAKHHAGNDDELPRDAFDLPALLAKLERHAPRMLAFTSKNAARAALGARVAYGPQTATFGSTRVFVLPSPSGQARGHWDIAPWRALALALREQSMGTHKIGDVQTSVRPETENNPRHP